MAVWRYGGMICMDGRFKNGHPVDCNCGQATAVAKRRIALVVVSSGGWWRAVQKEPTDKRLIVPV